MCSFAALALVSLVPAAHADLAEKLDSEYRTLLKDESAAFKLRRAERLLQANDPTNYDDVCEILRKSRSKAGVLLLLKHMSPHSKFASPRSVAAYAETIELLVGHRVRVPFDSNKSKSDREAATHTAVKKTYEEWWTPNKSKVTTDITQWSDKQLNRFVDGLLQQSDLTRDRNHDRAYDLHQIIKYDLKRLNDPRERGWHAEELDPVLVPILLARAGLVENASERPVRREFTIPYVAVGMLANLRENGHAPMLDEIAKDTKQDGSVRLSCVFATHIAGEKLLTSELLSVLESEKRLEPRLTATVALTLSRDSKLVGPTIVRLLGDPNKEIRAAAARAAGSSTPADALPKLEKLLDSDTTRRPGYLLGSICKYRNEDAMRIIAEYLESTLKKADRHSRYEISDALSAFENVSGRRWTSIGSHSEEYNRKKSEEALIWWRTEQAARARPGAM